MYDGGGNGRGSLKVEHGSDALEVTNVHEAGAGAVRYVVTEIEMGIKSNTKIANRGLRDESRGR